MSSSRSCVYKIIRFHVKIRINAQSIYADVDEAIADEQQNSTCAMILKNDTLIG